MAREYAEGQHAMSLFAKKFSLTLSCTVAGIGAVVAVLHWRGTTLQEELLHGEAECSEKPVNVSDSSS